MPSFTQRSLTNSATVIAVVASLLLSAGPACATCNPVACGTKTEVTGSMGPTFTVYAWSQLTAPTWKEVFAHGASIPFDSNNKYTIKNVSSSNNTITYYWDYTVGTCGSCFPCSASCCGLPGGTNWAAGPMGIFTSTIGNGAWSWPSTAAGTYYPFGQTTIVVGGSQILAPRSDGQFTAD